MGCSGGGKRGNTGKRWGGDTGSKFRRRPKRTDDQPGDGASLCLHPKGADGPEERAALGRDGSVYRQSEAYRTFGMSSDWCSEHLTDSPRPLPLAMTMKIRVRGGVLSRGWWFVLLSLSLADFDI